MTELDERVARVETWVERMDDAVIAALSEMRSAFGTQVNRVESKIDRLHRKFNWALAIVGPALALLMFEALTRG